MKKILYYEKQSLHLAVGRRIGAWAAQIAASAKEMSFLRKKEGFLRRKTGGKWLTMIFDEKATGTEPYSWMLVQSKPEFSSPFFFLFPPSFFPPLSGPSFDRTIGSGRVGCLLGFVKWWYPPRTIGFIWRSKVQTKKNLWNSKFEFWIIKVDHIIFYIFIIINKYVACWVQPPLDKNPQKKNVWFKTNLLIY